MLMRLTRKYMSVRFCFYSAMSNIFSKHCSDDTMEALRQQYLTFLQTKNFEKKTIALYDYAFRSFIKGTGVTDISGLRELQTAQIQSLLVFLSERLCLNSRGTVLPIIRQILSYLYTAGFIPTDFSGMILTPAYKKTHLRPYITASDEKKLFCAMEEAPLRTKAMMRLGLRLGLRDIDICCLRFSQIDWKNDQIILEQEKNGVTIYLPLLEDVGNAIMDYILNERPTEAKKNPYVFVRRQAPYKKLESMYMVCSKLFEKAEIQTVNRDSCGVHVCRYTLTPNAQTSFKQDTASGNHRWMPLVMFPKNPISHICQWKNRC